MPSTEIAATPSALNQNNNPRYLVWVGMLSGFFSYLLGPYMPMYLKELGFSVRTSSLEQVEMLVPGIVFGIFISLYFLKGNWSPKALLKSVVWVAISGVAYYSAVMTTLYLAIGFNRQNMQPLALLVGGLVGTLITVVGFRFFIARLSILQISALTLWGSVLTLSFYIAGFFNSGLTSNYFLQYFFLFILWQTGIALGIQLALKSKAIPQA